MVYEHGNICIAWPNCRAGFATVSEEVPKGTTSEIQLATDEIQDQSTDLKFTLNEDKCKDMRVYFAKSVQPDISPVRINNKEIDLISSAKILGLTIRTISSGMITCIQ
jgi:hypothetical protein